MLIRYCDLCGKEISINEDYAVVRTQVERQMFASEHVRGVRGISHELCMDCYKEFFDKYKSLKKGKCE